MGQSCCPWLFRINENISHSFLYCGLSSTNERCLRWTVLRSNKIPEWFLCETGAALRKCQTSCFPACVVTSEQWWKIGLVCSPLLYVYPKKYTNNSAMCPQLSAHSDIWTLYIFFSFSRQHLTNHGHSCFSWNRVDFLHSSWYNALWFGFTRGIMSITHWCFNCC